ncbi:MAG: DUF6261 family protein [Tannerellaceae bacterium]|jgi:hypothetical protein|nr:DUF6261 family protein [Tannerellaceae bacterium]
MKSVKAYSKLVFRLRNSEHFDFFEYIIQTVKPRINSVPAVVPMWNPLVPLFEKEDIIFKKSAKSYETKYISEANKQRYDVYMMMRRRIESAVFSFEEPEKDAGVKLTEILDNYKGIGSATMSDTSALITNMVQDLELKPRYSEAAAYLGLTNVISRIKKENEAFREIYMERAQSLEESELKGTMKDIRVQVDKSFKTFTQYLNASYTAASVTGSKDLEAIAALIDAVNAVIDQFERAMSYRIPGLRSNDKNDGDNGPSAPVEQTPVLNVADQEVTSPSYMKITFTDPQAYADALYPDALYGTLKLTSETVSSPFNEFMISRLDMDDETPVGFSVYPPNDKFVFDKPYFSMGECRGEVYKDDELLAIIEGLGWPATTGS